MTKLIPICTAAALLAGCSSVSAVTAYDTTEERVIAACKIERVQKVVPRLCADPVATARNVDLAKRVLRVLVDLAL